MRRCLLLLLALAVALPAIAQARSYDLPSRAAPTLAKVKRQTTVPVLLATKLELDFAGRLYVSGRGTAQGYDIGFDGARMCGGSACFLASMSARRGAALGAGTRVTIRPGVVGRFRPLACAATCSPPSIAFRRAGVRYVIRAKVLDGRRDLVRAARSALANGPR